MKITRGPLGLNITRKNGGKWNILWWGYFDKRQDEDGVMWYAWMPMHFWWGKRWPETSKYRPEHMVFKSWICGPVEFRYLLTPEERARVVERECEGE